MIVPQFMPDWSPLSRRAFLSRYAGGIGSLALSHLLASQANGESAPLGWPSVMQAGRAKSVMESLKGLCARTDRPSAALVQDLKQRGLLDETIVLWTGEFGRQPISQGADGRDHNRRGFSLWLAGGGFKAGHVHGATDDFGYAAVKDVVSVHDLHATLLTTLGIDHQRLTHPHEGRDASLTDAEVTKARIVRELLS